MVSPINFLQAKINKFIRSTELGLTSDPGIKRFQSFILTFAKDLIPNLLLYIFKPLIPGLLFFLQLHDEDVSLGCNRSRDLTLFNPLSRVREDIIRRL